MFTHIFVQPRLHTSIQTQFLWALAILLLPQKIIGNDVLSITCGKKSSLRLTHSFHQLLLFAYIYVHSVPSSQSNVSLTSHPYVHFNSEPLQYSTHLPCIESAKRSAMTSTTMLDFSMLLQPEYIRLLFFICDRTLSN